MSCASYLSVAWCYSLLWYHDMSVIHSVHRLLDTMKACGSALDLPLTAVMAYWRPL